MHAADLAAFSAHQYFAGPNSGNSIAIVITAEKNIIRNNLQ